MSGLLKLNLQDVAKGALTAVLAAVVMSLASVVQANGFDVLNADWAGIANMALSAAVSAFIGYVSKQLLSDENGAVLGRFGGKK